MVIKCLRVGNLTTNCYLTIDEGTSETLIIDPGDEGDFISTVVLENQLLPTGILLTHGHYDHCLAALELKLNFNIPIYLHQKDLFLYEKAHLSAKHFSGLFSPKLPPVDKYLAEDDRINFGNSILKVIHTPGHTPGSCCFLSSSEIRDLRSDILFTGDTLFANGVGRSDLSYSSKSDLQKSLSKLRTISHEQQTSPLIYPGHEDYGVFHKS